MSSFDLAVIGAQRSIPSGESSGAEETSVRSQVFFERSADGAGDVPGNRIDGVLFAPVALGRPGVEKSDLVESARQRFPINNGRETPSNP